MSGILDFEMYHIQQAATHNNKLLVPLVASSTSWLGYQECFWMQGTSADDD